MIGLIGKFAIGGAFLSVLFSLIYYAKADKNNDTKALRTGNYFFISQVLFVLVSVVLLVYIIATHQFQYFYVYNYTSLDLAFKYLLSAFYGGQEGSFLLWILFSGLVGLLLMRWSSKTYRVPVLFVMGITQLFLLSMILGVDVFGIPIGISPFRTLAEAFPDAPFIQANPNFIPIDGKGLNDLLKSPWMIIHPPALFLGFSLMTVPYAFAMAALWKRQYNDWIKTALPWILAANVSLFTAIFLGAYWAYMTLSFGGYWAWDPVENASLIPWIMGMAGVHAMLIQRKRGTSARSSIALALLSYIAVVYETFLTRSGILGDASVHSFVDLGLYNQLVVYIVFMTLAGLGLYLFRNKEIPKKETKNHWLDRDTWIFLGVLTLFITGMVIITGTSSPILGKIFQKDPTPPVIDFYNNWTLPFAIIMGILTVGAQTLWWKKVNAIGFANFLSTPLIITTFLTLAGVILGEIRTFKYILFLYSGIFTVVGNFRIMWDLVKRKPITAGGTLTHIGLGVLFIGILFSSAYNSFLLDDQTKAYNAAIRRGEVKDEMGTPIIKEVNLVELKKNTPKLINNEYLISYTGERLSNENRPSEQIYTIKVKDLDGNEIATLEPTVYPMLTSSTAEHINWTVDPDVHPGFLNDIYIYVAGSSWVERENERVAKAVAHQTEAPDNSGTQHLTFSRGQKITIGNYEITFEDFIPIKPETDPDYPENATIAVRAKMIFKELNTGEVTELSPVFAILRENNQNLIYSPPAQKPGFSVSVQVMQLFPTSDQVELHLTGLDGEVQQEDWVLLFAEKKPLVSFVWWGVYLMIAGFVISIARRIKERSKESDDD